MPPPADILSDIADAILGYRDGLIAVLHHAYFDESGTHDGSPIMGFGAYLFTADQARKFSRDWGKDLARLGLPFAHMTDCATGNGPYKDMTMEQRIESGKLLIAQIKRRSIVGYAIVTHKPSYELLMQGLDAQSLYTFLLQIAVLKVRDLAAERGIKQIAYFFESGHRFASEAHEHMNFLASLPKHKEYFLYAGHAFVDKRNVLPLQAADMLAWQECHYRIRQLEGHDKRRADYNALTRPVDKFTTIQPEEWLKLMDWKQRGITRTTSMPQPLLEGLLETGMFERVKGYIKRGDVLLRCPTTDKSVPIGLTMSKQAFDTADLSMPDFECRACGGVHPVTKEALWLHE